MSLSPRHAPARARNRRAAAIFSIVFFVLFFSLCWRFSILVIVYTCTLEYFALFRRRRVSYSLLFADIASNLQYRRSSPTVFFCSSSLSVWRLLAADDFAFSSVRRLYTQNMPAHKHMLVIFGLFNRRSSTHTNTNYLKVFRVLRAACGGKKSGVVVSLASPFIRLYVHRYFLCQRLFELATPIKPQLNENFKSAPIDRESERKRFCKQKSECKRARARARACASCTGGDEGK